MCNFELTSLVIADLNPNKIITSAKTEVKFINFLKKKCNLTDDTTSHLNDEEASDLDENDQHNNNKNSDEEDEEENNNNDGDFKTTTSNQSKTTLFIATSNDFMFDTSRQLIHEITSLENMPEFNNVCEYFQLRNISIWKLKFRILICFKREGRRKTSVSFVFF